MAGEVEQGLDRHASVAKSIRPAEFRQIDHEQRSGNLSTRTNKQLSSRKRGAASGDQIIDDEHAMTGLQGVVVDLQPIGSIFERVINAYSRAGQLPRLSNGKNSGTERARYGRAEDETPRFDPGDQIAAVRSGEFNKLIDRGGKARAVDQ